MVQARTWQIKPDGRPKTGALYFPRIDQPWKAIETSVPPVIADATLAVRLDWKAFTSHLVNRFETRGIRMEVCEIPAWQITADRINTQSGDFALIAHKCRFQLPGLKIPSAFYMQEYMPWLFTLDTDGWGAGASAYPMALPQGIPDNGSFAHYQARLADRSLATKFPQAPRASAQGAVAEFDIFMPLQIPHDQVIAYFSDVAEMDVVKSLVDFVRANNLKLALKPHPANMNSMEIFRPFVDDTHVFWREDNIHDLIAASRAVYTLNSSVGFEAMLHEKPVVTFGRTPYDCVTIKGDINDQATAWQACLDWIGKADSTAYRDFYAWYCESYAVDMSRPDIRNASLERLVDAMIARVYGEAESA